MVRSKVVVCLAFCSLAPVVDTTTEYSISDRIAPEPQRFSESAQGRVLSDKSRRVEPTRCRILRV